MFDLRKVAREIKEAHGLNYDHEHKIAIDESKRLKLILDAQGEQLPDWDEALPTNWSSHSLAP